MCEQPRPVSLRDALEQAGDLTGRTLFGADHEVAFVDMLGRTCLPGAAPDLLGRNVLLATQDHFTAAIALMDLDGVAERILLCTPDLDPAHLPSLIAEAAIDTIVTDRTDFRSLTETLRTHRPVWPAHPAEPPGAPPRRTEWLLLTSGTTGVPKMVRHSFEGLTAPIKRMPASARAPVWSTFYDIRRYGGLQIFLRGVLGTGSLVLSSPGEPLAGFLTRVGQCGVTHMSGTPSHWRRALANPALDRMKPDYVRLSGEVADQAILDALRHAFPAAAVGHAYASTEAGVGFEVDDGLAGFSAEIIGRRDGDVDLKVRNGSLHIRSPRTASGYLGSPGLDLLDDDGFVDTGDIVEERDGRFQFMGRRGGIINVGGLKVNPEEVEAVINRHPKVRTSLVAGQKNPITGAVVVASVVLQSDSGRDVEALRHEILACCRAALAAYKVPVVLRFVTSLDITSAGKLARVSYGAQIASYA